MQVVVVAAYDEISQDRKISYSLLLLPLLCSYKTDPFPHCSLSFLPSFPSCPEHVLITTRADRYTHTYLSTYRVLRLPPPCFHLPPYTTLLTALKAALQAIAAGVAGEAAADGGETRLEAAVVRLGLLLRRRPRLVHHLLLLWLARSLSVILSLGRSVGLYFYSKLKGFQSVQLWIVSRAGCLFFNVLVRGICARRGRME